MKQHITKEQFDELSEKGKKEFKEWLDKKDYYVLKILGIPKYEINIGIMIEFLDEHLQGLCLDLDINKGKVGGNCYINGNTISSLNPPEFCDALWEAVKEILNK